MKKIIITFLLIISDIIYGDDFIINKICFDGLKRVSLDTALYNLPLKVGNIISDDDIANSIKMLFSTGYFEEISIFNNNYGIIVITVKERPVINTIKLHGNKIITSEIIEEILDIKKIKTGQPLNNYSIFELKNVLEDICYNFGKFSATIKIITIPLTQNRVDLQIMLFEGKTAKINQINIFGNRVFSQKQLLKQFKLNNQTRWKKILSHNKYHKQKIFNDLEALRIFYLNRGYAKFHIDDARIDLTSDKKNIYLSVYITEGSEYSLKSLVIYGNVLNYIPKIKEYLKIYPGESYNENKIKKIEHNIRCILGKYGYIKPDISMECDFDDYNKTIKLYTYIDVGTCFYVREISVEGNNITQDSVIRREIKQIEQTPLNYTSILKDQEQLQRFNYFKTVDTRIEYLPDILNQINLVYKIKESNAGNLNLSIGLGTESGLNVQIGMHQENILGTGNSMSITATKNYYQTYVDISTLKRYFGIKKNNISGKFFYNSLLSNKVDLSNYNIKNYGINVNYSYPFAKYKTYTIGLDYISNNLSQIAPQIAIWRYLYSVGINPKVTLNNKFLNNNINFCTNDFLLVSQWDFNNLNRIYFPESGSCINITGKLTLPGSVNQYYKIIFHSDHYLSLDKSSNWIFINTIYAGYAGGLYSKKESPFYDNFYIGGIGTIRGFRLNSIGPKAAYYSCDNFDTSYSTCAIKNSQDTVGGNAVIFIKNELMIPIASYINNHSEFFDTTRISLFIDAGTAWDTYWKNTKATRVANIPDYSVFGRIRISGGVSLKWISPMGPVMFSYSKLIKKYPGDIEEPFQFNIGSMW